MLQFLIPMAGAGKRFAEAGYRDPKPFIYVEGRPMILGVVDDLILAYGPSERARMVFLYQVAHEPYVEFLAEHILYAYPDVAAHFEPVDGVTQGAACTVLLAEDLLDPDEPLIIANSDQRFKATVDGWCGSNHILTFRATESKWSYAVLQEDGVTIDAVAEKPLLPPSEHATVGVYGFGRAGDCFRAIREMIAADNRTNGEFYLAPATNYLDRAPYAVPVLEMHGLGTPEDLERYLRRAK